MLLTVKMYQERQLLAFPRRQKTIPMSSLLRFLLRVVDVNNVDLRGVQKTLLARDRDI